MQFLESASLEMEGNNEGATELHPTCLAGCRTYYSSAGIGEIVEFRGRKTAGYGSLRLPVVSGHLLDLTKTENESLALASHCFCLVLSSLLAALL